MDNLAIKQNIAPIPDRIGAQRGLNYDVSLLWEYPQADGPAVDWQEPENFSNNTGQEMRSIIGLPQLKEPTVLRHFVRLSTKNYGIDNGFFPLGSCTMKHNPRLNEKMARLPGFAHIHPEQPEETVQGALALMYDLQRALAELTGLPEVSLAPAAGAHGELAGMMVIKRAHEAAGNRHKTVVLCPDSAHGTNPATAVTCGYSVRTIDTKGTGRLTLAAFKDALYKGQKDGSDVAGMMVTNPNTCGLFESDILEITKLLHEAGGYFYCDGANFNALVGHIRPGDFGVDVMHLNLHKTFSTPHGGGGPGSGPICVTKELAPYIPVPHVKRRDDGGYTLERDRDTSLGRMKGYHGQFGMHIRALTYILSHGADGLKQVSQDAVLSANYILSQLKNSYHVPYAGPCMHECLLTDKRQKESDVTTLDIAKTLVEYGIHPMTVYFPLTAAGAMLIEPTETESKAEIDRFIAIMQMIAQKAEMNDVEAFKSYPVSAPRKRLDEVKAAREPRLGWKNSDIK